jgi:hypothetical protein
MIYILFVIIIIIKIFEKSIKIINSKNSFNITSKFIKNELSGPGNKLILIPHLELGDNIVFNGIVRYYCSKYDKVVLICKKTYFKQLEYMYFDLDNLILYPINGGILEGMDIKNEFYYDKNIQKMYDYYKITFAPVCMYYDYYENVTEYDRSKCGRLHYPNDFFDYLNLPINIRYDNFKINRDLENENILYNNLINIIGDKYNIIIDDEKKNIVINDNHIKNEYPIFKLSSNSTNKNKELNTITSDNIFNYIKILKNAQEIHTINSSIAMLIDALDIQVKTYIYAYLRQQQVEYRNKNFLYIK